MDEGLAWVGWWFMFLMPLCRWFCYSVERCGKHSTNFNKTPSRSRKNP